MLVCGSFAIAVATSTHVNVTPLIHLFLRHRKKSITSNIFLKPVYTFNSRYLNLHKIPALLICV